MTHEMERPFLAGERIYLRPLEVEDVTDEYLHWMNDVELAKFIPAMTFPGTRKAVQDYVAREVANPTVIFLAIVVKKTGQHVGNIKLGPINWIDRNAEYGILVGDAPSRSKGYGSEAVRMILSYAFDILNLYKIFATSLASNKVAIRSYEKIGLSVEATVKEKRFVEGRYEDVVWMGVTRNEWPVQGEG